MSMSIYRDPFTMYPTERFFRRTFNDMMRDVTDPMMMTMRPYWTNQSMLNQCNIGNPIGTITNDREKFAVEMNVSQFTPEELSVTVRDRDLIIEGHHEEKTDEYGTIERHFTRKYRLPDDSCMEDIQSQLREDGTLAVTAPKKTLEKGRKIPIMPAPAETQQKK